MFSRWAHAARRRADLSGAIDVASSFRQWEESCVPSYCHRNRLAAFVSWQRLFTATRLADKHVPRPRRVLDFGSSVGELGHLVADGARYDFVEQDPNAVAYLLSRLPAARQQTLSEAPDGAYDQVFAIDSLEHNDDFAELLATLSAKLSTNGILVLSGPTESRLYRFGRAVAGFSGGYHKTDIRAIEAAASAHLARIDLATILPLAPLFRVSVWRAPAAADR